MLKIREASETDFDKVWRIFQAIASAGDSYAYPTDVTEAEGRRLWLNTPRKTFVAEDGGELLGTFYIKTNQAGPGAHVCNCGYMVASGARGRGVATAMCRHSQTLAMKLGYEAMQFNFVASSTRTPYDSGRDSALTSLAGCPGPSSIRYRVTSMR